jgi:hypothetical protein
MVCQIQGMITVLYVLSLILMDISFWTSFLVIRFLRVYSIYQKNLYNLVLEPKLLRYEFESRRRWLMD